MAKEKEYVVTFSIHGTATAIARAANIEEAKKKAKQMDVSDGEIVEWGFDEFSEIEENV